MKKPAISPLEQVLKAQGLTNMETHLNEDGPSDMNKKEPDACDQKV